MLQMVQHVLYLTKRRCSSIYKGVHWYKKGNKWCASICFNKKRLHIGLYDTEEEGAFAYNKKAIELFGEYAHLNVIKKLNNC